MATLNVPDEDQSTKPFHGHGQKRSIVDIIQELQRQIQAYGPGPFTPEQSKELDKLKVLYIKAKQEYEKQLKALQASGMTTVPSGQQQPGIQLASSIPCASSVAMTQNISSTSVAHIQQQLQANQTVQVHAIGQTTQSSVPTYVNTQAIVGNTVMRPSVQLIGSVPGQIIQTTGSTITSIGGIAQHTSVTNVSGVQTQVRPIATAVNVGGQGILLSGPTVQQQPQQHLRMLGIANHQRTVAPAAPTTVVNTAAATTSKQSSNAAGLASDATNSQASQLLTKRKLQDLLHEIDPRETMDEDVEEVLLQIADDFIEKVVTSSCQIAKHRKSSTLEAKDIQLHLDRCWNMWIPGFGHEDLRPHKKLPTTDAHRQRLAIIKKSMKK